MNLFTIDTKDCLSTGFSPCLYYQPDHLKTQTDRAIYGFILSRQEISAVIAKFHCAQDEHGIWNSPPKAPFGGIVIEKRCSGSELEFFLNCIKKWLSMCSHGKLIVKAAPAFYNQSLHDLLHHCYINTGFVPIRTLANHFIFPKKPNFYDIIRQNERRRLKKAQKAGFQAKFLTGVSPEVIVAFLLKCHRGNNYCLSMQPAQLQNLLAQFPNHFLVFGAYNQEKLIALAVMVRVNMDTLSYYTSAFLPEYRSFSPMVLVMDHIYGFCRQNHISMLDLGTSLDHEGNYKPSLARFKENIGGEVCPKITYELTF
ncbi:GNAT family N-acetyltransferase [Dyadobacter luticola]|uniref:GNAT family N-acetyltransferase n=1 Tax=Dyadobacter luticola TaxID=1979387 RepID=A0A5R9KXT2_9BACT|nr:GNAT family N-acetyltransferase [Dyadobacter luticola]TLV00958.1 GNAT family N-acetyltransferase [Dyadobacter luticola]